MDKYTSKKLEVIIPAYRWHSQSFVQLLEGISEEDAIKRVDGRTNHIIWIVGNFVNMRYSLAWILGLEEPDPYSDLFFQGKALNEEYNYPTLQQLKDSFHTISPKAYEKLLQATDKQLNTIFEMGMASSFYEETVLNFVGMCIGREDYLSGQLALMRRILNYPSMSYEIDETLKY